MLKIAIKSGILGASIYYTVDVGIWKDSDTTSVLYEDVQKKVEPYISEVKSQIPFELPPLPASERVSYLSKHYWNSGVKTAFKFLVDLPTHASDAASKSYDYINNALNQQTEANTEATEK